MNIGRITPIYPCTGKLTQNAWRRVMMNALESHGCYISEILPKDLIAQKSFPERAQAVHDMHFPETNDAHEDALNRLKFEESLLMQLAICGRRMRARHGQTGRAFRISSEVERRIRTLLPFRLTSAQDRVVGEIIADMKNELPMHRLLQGDVGSGKTAVAIYAMLAAVACSSQVCIMAPTSLLAQQHFVTTKNFLANSAKNRVTIDMLIGGATKTDRARIMAKLSSGATDILVATHAAIQDDINFKDLGLVVIDEQHKFGVGQRTRLTEKGLAPDILVMTATPIPRSLALTVYGDLDVSVIDELPPGRMPVKTSAPQAKDYEKVWKFIRKELSAGRQAFIVSPLVDQSETLDMTSATEAYEHLKDNELSGFKLALLHGRMKRPEQDEVMQRFRAGEIDALISTVVIEVGVDIPNATVMAVMHAERFGLAQLHQLRGRIGRGGKRGYFILLSDTRTPEAEQRLNILVETSDGFKISEEDLKMRGPGQFLGTRQHGLPELKVVDIVADLDMIRSAKKDAEKILEADPKLNAHLALKSELKKFLLGPKDEAGIG